MGAETKYRPAMSPPILRKRLILIIFAALTLAALSFLSFPTLRWPLLLDFDFDSQCRSEQEAIPKNVAVIIEDRPLIKLEPLLLHFSSVLGPAWPVILFTTPEHEVVPKSAPLQRAVEEGRVSIQYLPSDVRFKRQADIRGFLTLPWLWHRLAPAEHVLLFQSDSIICANSPLKVEDFLEYDFIGAPIDPRLGPEKGFSGGLSLRNRSMVLDIVNKSSWYAERNHARDPEDPRVELEDQWLLKKMKELPVLPNGSPAARLPSVEVATTFSVQTVWYENPLSYHQVERWHRDKIHMVDQWCPEHRMATVEPLVRN